MYFDTQNSPSLIYHLYSNVFLFIAVRQRCKQKWRFHNKRLCSAIREFRIGHHCAT
jgi:hypothetical protein